MNTKNLIKIRPSILVSLKTSINGGVSYTRTDLAPGDAPATLESANTTVARWETLKVVDDATEHDRATETVNKASSEIRRLCVKSPFLLCPVSLESELDEAVTRARAIVGDFNATALHSKVTINVLRCFIADTDAEATAAIAEEIRSLVSKMDEGIVKLDVAAIREAAGKASQLSAMLGDEQVEIVAEAVKAARAAARTIVKRVQKNAEDGAVVLADINREKLDTARMAFLDLDDTAPVAVDSDSMPIANVQRVAELDLGPESDEDMDLAPVSPVGGEDVSSASASMMMREIEVS